MASNPQLPNHLIRELTNIVRCRGKGEAMVRLALAGEEPFSVFRYVVEHHVVANTSMYGVFLHSVFPPETASITPWCRDLMFLTKGRSIYLRFVTDGSERLVIRFVRELQAYCIPSNPLLFEKIIELTIVKFDKSLTPMFSWFQYAIISRIIEVTRVYNGWVQIKADIIN